MKTFEVGQKVWIYRRADVDLDEGTVSSVSPSGAVVGVTLANGSVQRFPAREHYRLQLMTWVEVGRLREKRRIEDEARAAKAECQYAVRRLAWAVDDAPPVGGDPLYVLRQTTAQIDAMTQALTQALTAKRKEQQ